MSSQSEVEGQSVPDTQSVVQEIPDTPEIPSHLEQGGVAVTQTQFTAQVTDDQGQPMIQAPSTSNIKIQIPADPQTLEGWSKGSITESITWYAVFWLRLIKKAVLKGWHIIVGKS